MTKHILIKVNNRGLQSGPNMAQSALWVLPGPVVARRHSPLHKTYNPSIHYQKMRDFLSVSYEKSKIYLIKYIR